MNLIALQNVLIFINGFDLNIISTKETTGITWFDSNGNFENGFLEFTPVDWL